MQLDELRTHVRTLASLEPSDAPVISCYVAAADTTLDWRALLGRRGEILARTLPETGRAPFAEAWQRVQEYLLRELKPETKGAAVFARGGNLPLFLALQFPVPLPHWITVDATPNLYHLMELKDTYHRFVVLLSTENSARILEVNLGAVTENIWLEQPATRARIGSGWTRQHYQHHRREQTEQFIREKIRVLEQLMSAGGHTHLILAGDPAMTVRVQTQLPAHLPDKLVSRLDAWQPHDVSRVVRDALTAFVLHEQAESLAMVDKLLRELRTGGLAVIGAVACLQALYRAQADALVIDRDCVAEPAWQCEPCGAFVAQPVAPSACPNCRQPGLHAVNSREEMMRLAGQHGCHVEVVNDSQPLRHLGGVGCLLRY